MDGGTLAGWCVIARSSRERIDIMFGLVITTEAHLALSGARTHSSDTAEMTDMIEALSFLGHRGPVARDTKSCIHCWCVQGHDTGPHTRSVCTCESTGDAKRPTQGATYHAACSWTFRKFG